MREKRRISSSVGKSRERQIVSIDSPPGFGYREHGCKRISVKFLFLVLEPECQKDLVWSIVWVFSQTGTIAGGVIMKLMLFLKLTHLLSCQKTSKRASVIE